MGNGSLKSRFSDWWNGKEFEAADETLRVAGSDDAIGERRQDGDEENSQAAPSADPAAARIDALQLIFGAGEDGPAATARCRSLIAPLELNGKHSVVEVGCQLGAGLRVIAGDAGAWIDGVEPVACFVEASRQLIIADGLEDRALALNTTLDDERIQKHRRDAAISRESLHRFKDRKAVLKSIHALLKQQGQMVFTDYVVEPTRDKTELETWMDLHATRPSLVPLDVLRSELIGAGFDVRVARNVSKAFCATIFDEIRRFAEGLRKNRIPRAMGGHVIAEVEYWARVVAAIQSGALQLAHFHAIKEFDDPFA